MPRLRWTNEGVRFTDRARNFVATAGEYDIDDEDRAEEYLAHPSDGWERVDDEGDGGSTENEDDGSDEEGDTQTLIGADRATLEAADYSRLRRAAMSDDVEGVDGRSSKAEIIDALADE